MGVSSQLVVSSCFPPCRSCSLRMRCQYSWMTCTEFLQKRHNNWCCSAFCDWTCLFTIVVMVAIVVRDNPKSDSNTFNSSYLSKCATLLFERVWHFLICPNSLTFLGMGVILHLVNCLSFAVQEDRKLPRLIHLIFQAYLRVITTECEFRPFVFCCGFWRWSYVLSSENDEIFFDCSFFVGILLPKSF